MSNIVETSSTEISQSCINRLVKDITSLYKQPLTKQGIYYQHDDSNMLYGYAMIIGPKDTPYEHGFFFFKFTFPYNYPVSPPKVTYMTNDGYTRFHPNLYRNGKVCLSILNTWKGEGWTSCQTIRSVLLTLVSILDETPLLNEPGIRPTNMDVIPYTETIQYKTLEYAHLHAMDRDHIPPEFIAFHTYIMEYAKENKEKVMSLCKTLSKKKKAFPEIGIYNMKRILNYKKLYKSCEKIYESI